MTNQTIEEAVEENVFADYFEEYRAEKWKGVR